VFSRLGEEHVAIIFLKMKILLSNLQGKVRKQIEDGMVPPFYTDKLQVDPHTRVPVSLALSILS
jgi:hypothetical protein